MHLENKKKASVIVCTYNREQSLCDTLSDLIHQDYKDLEIIVVDQTPVHEEETEKFLTENASLISLYRCQFANLPKARNYGLRKANGEIIVFIDDDIRLEKNAVELLLRHFDDKAVSGVAPIVVDDRGLDIALSEYSKKYKKSYESIHGKLIKAHTLIGATIAVRKWVAEEIDGFDEIFGELHPSASGEDLDFSMRAHKAGHQLFVDPEVTVQHFGYLPGGCGVRTNGIQEAPTAQLRAQVYMILKDKKLETRLKTWYRLFRLCVSRSYLARMQLLCIFQKVEEVKNALNFVSKFLSAREINASKKNSI